MPRNARFVVLEVDHSTDARLAGAGVLIMDCDTGVELLDQYAGKAAHRAQP